jgi:hypothetical protein
MLDRNSASVVLAFVKAARDNTKPPTDLEPPKAESMALVFAFQALFYKKFRMPTFAQKCFGMSKKLISTSFDQVLSNTNTVFTYFALGCCHLMDNELEKAEFYFENAKSFIAKYKRERKATDANTEQQIENLRIEFLETFLVGVDPAFELELSLSVKRCIYLAFLMKHYHRLTETQEDPTMLQEELDEFTPYLTPIKKDLLEKCNKHFVLEVPMLDRMISKLHNVNTRQTQEDKNTWFRRASLLLCTLGAKIQLLQKRGQCGTLELRGLADYISATASSYSSAMSTHLVAPMLVATNCHMDCLATATTDEDRNLITNALKTDANILQTIMSSNGRTAAQYGHYVPQVLKTLAEEEERRRKQKIEAVLQQTTHVAVPSTPEFIPMITTPVDTNQNLPNELEEFLSDFCATSSEKEKSLYSNDDIMFWQVMQ